MRSRCSIFTKLAGVWRATGSGGFSPALSRDKLILNLPEDSSNIWLAEPESAK